MSDQRIYEEEIVYGAVTSSNSEEIATPGEVFNKDGEKVIDDKYCTEKFEPGYITEYVKIPMGEYFVLGDMRESSIDSRNTLIGCVAKDQIVGKVFFRIWPFQAIRFF